MKLIGFSSSPYVRKVRITMAEKKLDYQYVTENVWEAETRISESNPLGKVPCLVMEGAEALFDSRVIVEYLENLSPVGKLIPVSGRERAEVKTWEALADGVIDAAVLARLEATWDGRTKAQRSQVWIDRQLAKIDASLKAMSRGLADKPFCAGIHLSLADIAVGCALGYLDFRFQEIASAVSAPAQPAHQGPDHRHLLVQPVRRIPVVVVHVDQALRVEVQMAGSGNRLRHIAPEAAKPELKIPQQETLVALDDRPADDETGLLQCLEHMAEDRLDLRQPLDIVERIDETGMRCIDARQVGHGLRCQRLERRDGLRQRVLHDWVTLPTSLKYRRHGKKASSLSQSVKRLGKWISNAPRAQPRRISCAACSGVSSAGM